MAHDAALVDDHGAPKSFVTRWVYSTNHKDIGTLYLTSAFIAGVVGLILSVIFPAGIDAARHSSTSPTTRIFYNVFVTAHGLIMVFFFIMPALIGGFGNWMMPLMIGAPDMAFPRMNNISFWLLVPAFILLVGSMFIGDGVGGGWTIYPPLSSSVGNSSVSVDMAIFALHLAGASSLARRDQLHHHDLQYAGAGHDDAQDAAFCLVDPGDGIPSAPRRSRSRRRDHHAFDGP